ncbi:MAG: DUF2207 domain-containing protein [Myxococcales bacterium]|nr:DUF2207 domain-containing protein [Myxococcales bacterium]MCB9532432.1 DUF2207 domain-containing protein [Myxococcales bacterium]MCB9533514.1 DUF2207 domain-containing protein [Myxococcales bacterium]
MLTWISATAVLAAGSLSVVALAADGTLDVAVVVGAEGEARIVETRSLEQAGAPWVDVALDAPPSAATEETSDDTGGAAVSLRAVEDGEGSALRFELLPTPWLLTARVWLPEERSVHELRLTFDTGSLLTRGDRTDELAIPLAIPQRDVASRTLTASVSLPPGVEVVGLECMRGFDPDALRAATGGADGAGGCEASVRDGVASFIAPSVSPDERVVAIVATAPGAIPRLPVGVRLADLARRSFGFWGALPMIGAILVAFVALRARRDRDVTTEQSNGPPAALGPAEVGLIWRGGHADVDIVAIVADLIRRGHLAFSTEVGPTFIEGRRERWQISYSAQADPLRDYERVVLDLLLDGSAIAPLADARPRLARGRARVWRAIAAEVAAKGRAFAADPVRTHAALTAAAAILAGSGALAAALGEPRAALSLIATAAALALGRRYTALRTAAGARVHGEIAGFERFVREATPASLQLAEVATSTHRDALYPYALVIGAGDGWLAAYDALGRGDRTIRTTRAVALTDDHERREDLAELLAAFARALAGGDHP